MRKLHLCLLSHAFTSHILTSHLSTHLITCISQKTPVKTFPQETPKSVESRAQVTVEKEEETTRNTFPISVSHIIGDT